MAITEPTGIRLGTANCYLVPASDGYFLVDAGAPGRAGVFFRRLRRLGVAPDRINLIVITHAHHDHVGSLLPIARATAAPVLIHLLPPFGDDAAAIRSGWQRLLAAGATRVYPGHLSPFPAELLRRHPPSRGSSRVGRGLPAVPIARAHRREAPRCIAPVTTSASPSPPGDKTRQTRYIIDKAN